MYSARGTRSKLTRFVTRLWDAQQDGTRPAPTLLEFLEIFGRLRPHAAVRAGTYVLEPEPCLHPRGVWSREDGDQARHEITVHHELLIPPEFRSHYVIEPGTDTGYAVSLSFPETWWFLVDPQQVAHRLLTCLLEPDSIELRTDTAYHEPLRIALRD